LKESWIGHDGDVINEVEMGIYRFDGDVINEFEMGIYRFEELNKL